MKNFEISSNYRLNPNETDSKEELEIVCDELKNDCSKDRVGIYLSLNLHRDPRTINYYLVREPAIPWSR